MRRFAERAGEQALEVEWRKARLARSLMQPDAIRLFGREEIAGTDQPAEAGVVNDATAHSSEV